MFVPLYSFGPRAVNTRRQRPRPPFALALRCHGQACPAPSFGGCRRASLWNWARVQNLARGVALSPKLGGDCVSQAGPAPAAQHLHGMRCRDGSPGPTTLVRARRNAEGQRPRPPFALALRCHGQACPAPSLADAAVRHFGIGRVYKTWHAASPCPPNSAAIVSVRRVQPQQPSTCTVCEVSRWLAGPHHLGESSQEREGYRYLERASGLVLATAAHILKLDRYRED
ncbi:hypothetical protein G5714_024749 [Onychostoma macrolepis]|uniref:Uncharacterized protein n=1 Tax=Onychostoma macrolepis TaxID=369639 RepID=A0A7J6BHZ4_9TELE|nr:hypothetical protein G5714_024749 [Onychostoma macrolepis]